MIRTLGTVFITLVATLSLGSISTDSATAAVAVDRPPLMLGPGDANVSGIENEALIRWSRFGYVYISGQHNSHLTITFDKAKNVLQYRDTGTARLNSFPKGCERKRAKQGIAVDCWIPHTFDGRKMFVQVWPRLGSDYVDARSLGKKFRSWVLTDDGNDVVLLGDGNDFVNGAMGNDRIEGGAGRDWLRGGPGYDRINGGADKDRISQG